MNILLNRMPQVLDAYEVQTAVNTMQLYKQNWDKCSEGYEPPHHPSITGVDKIDSYLTIWSDEYPLLDLYKKERVELEEFVVDCFACRDKLKFDDKKLDIGLALHGYVKNLKACDKWTLVYTACYLDMMECVDYAKYFVGVFTLTNVIW